MNSSHKLMMKSPIAISTTIFKYLLALTISFLIIACGTTQTKPQVNTNAETDSDIEQQPQGFNEIDQSVYQNAKQYLENGDIKKAENQFKSLSRKYPKNPQVIVNLATCQYLGENYEKSAQTLSKIETQANNVAEYFNLKGLLAVHDKKFPEAEKAYLKSLNINSKFANAHYNLALLYDIYYQDIKSAFIHYTEYLSNIDHEDQETKDWVEQLKYSLEL